MSKFYKLTLAAVVAAAAFVHSTTAQAGMVVQYSLDGGTTKTTIVSVASGAPANFSGTFGSFTIDFGFAQSNSPGTPAIANLVESTFSITNNSGSIATIDLYFGDTDFSGPSAPPAPGVKITSQIGGSRSTGSTGFSYQSWVDEANGQNSLVGKSPGLQTIAFGVGSFDNTLSKNFTTLSSGYSISQRVTATLAGKAVAGWNSTTTVVPVPEPASLAMWGLGALGMMFARKRRQAKLVA